MEFFEAHNVSKSFANHKALNNVSITVPKQRIFGLLGPNGAGKTTLLRIINQITGPDEGEVLLNGKKLQPDDTKLIGYLPEERGLYKKMKVGEQALYLAQLKGLTRNEAMTKLKAWFTRFEIIDWWDRKVEELSKGMQQKIQFIVTIVHEPSFLIFDEPFSGFDPINANLLKEEILKLRENGATVIFSTHNMASVEEICDDIALISKSEKILEGNVRDIREKYKKNLFDVRIGGLGETEIIKINSGFEIVKKSYEDRSHHLTIKIPSHRTPNDLINDLVKHGEIKGFNEILPTMNEVFIQAVGDQSSINNNETQEQRTK